jgi:hypothetical protein
LTTGDGLDPYDVKVVRAGWDGQAALARTLVSSSQATEDGLHLLLARERYRHLHECPGSGCLKVRAVTHPCPDDANTSR